MEACMNRTAKGFSAGTHRAISPAETLAWVQPFLASMGITRIANVTGLDRLGSPVINVFRPNSRSLSVAQGKGLTLEAAKASGVMEAIESFHAEQIDHPTETGSYNDVAPARPVVDLEGLPRLEGTRFDATRPLIWIEGQNLMNGEPLWLPYETVHTNYTLPKQPDAGCFVASTNGLASGNHRYEAIGHGITEVIERDANTLWDQLPFEAKNATRVDTASIDDEACRSLVTRLRENDMAVGIWDMTTDTGVASFYCLILDERIEGGHSGGGAGSHPSREIALLRALTEAVQVRTNYITGARDDLAREEYEHDGVARKNQYARHLIGAKPSNPVDFRMIPTRFFKTFEEDADWLLEQLSKAGIAEVICVDLTRSEFNIPVVRVVIPGLEGPHDHDEYCPGARSVSRVQGLS